MTPIDCSCLIFSGFAENDEVVAVEDFLDVGNILGKSWVSLYHLFVFIIKKTKETSGIEIKSCSY